MANYDELIHTSAAIEVQELSKENQKRRPRSIIFRLP